MQKKERLPLAVQLLLISAFLMNIGQFAILSFLAVYLTNVLHEAPWQVGTILGLNGLCARVLPLITGIIGDRTQHSRSVIFGMLVRGSGYLVFAFAQNFPLLICATCLTGIGTAFYSPSINAIFAEQKESLQTRAFTRFNQALNLGAILGPLLGSLLLFSGPKLPFLVGGALFLGVAGMLFVFRHLYSVQTVSPPLQASFRQVWSEKRFLVFVLIMILFWTLYTQLALSFPLQAFRITHQQINEGLVLSVNGLAGIILMIGLAKVFRKFSPLSITCAGMLVTGIGLGLVALFPASYSWFLCCVVIYTLGETLVQPGANMVVAKFSKNGAHGTFFGIASLSWAVGAILGSYLGTWLMAQSNLALPWIVYGILGLLGFCLLIALRLRPQERQEVSSSRTGFS